MPFHDKKTLEHWVREFINLRGAGEEIKVAVQDGSNGENTGLILVPIDHLPNSVYIEACGEGDSLEWCVFVEPASETVKVSSHEMNAVTHQLQVAAELCAFVQEKSLGYFETDGSVDATDVVSPS